MTREFKMMSLFDGSGGFPLAATMCGIRPVAASEIEPYPIAVTRSRFPEMKHLGDITKIDGAEIEAVDLVTFGSPCQDLSVAGKRAGLKHTDKGDAETTRSGLFLEAIRIIKEMREATNGNYPRFALWENVPGAFSSNKGEDFRLVLQELIQIAEPEATVPPIPDKGHWPYHDCYMGDGWSLAYRTFDTQYWPGTPQRRRRIYLTVDFGGQCAKEISFERPGLRGHFETFQEKGKRIAPDAEGSVGTADQTGTYRIGAYYSAGMMSPNPHAGVGETDISSTLDCNGGSPASQQGGICIVEPVPQPMKHESSQEEKAEISGQGKHAIAYHSIQNTTANEQMASCVSPEKPKKEHLEAHISEAIPINTMIATRHKKLGQGTGFGVGDVGDPQFTISGGHEHAVAYTLKIRSGCEGGGKGPLVQKDKSATLSTNNDQYVFQPMSISNTASTLRAGAGAPKHESDFVGQIVAQPIAFTQNQRDEVRDLKGKTGALAAEAGMKQQTYVAIPEVENICLDDQGGEQITARTDGTSPTLRAEMHGNVPCVLEVAGFKAGQGAAAQGIGWQEEQSPTLTSGTSGTNQAPAVCVKCYDARGNGDGETASTITGDHEDRINDYTNLICTEEAEQAKSQHLFENHAQDARYKGPLEVCPMLPAQLGTGGDNTPFVVEEAPPLCVATQQGGAEITEDLGPTITASAGMSGNNQPVLCMASGQKNAEYYEELSPCLNCDHEQPIVIDQTERETFQNTGIGWWNHSNVGATCRTSGGDAPLANLVLEPDCAGINCRNLTEHSDAYPTLQAKPNGGWSLNFTGAVRVHYIVRRLTPTECARLQGFPDWWGNIDPKEDFTEEEYEFWSNVRNTHADANGKKKRDYTKKQMLSWYNKLHSDSAEYRMWGNGIALPPTLYVMQGIEDALWRDYEH